MVKRPLNCLKPMKPSDPASRCLPDHIEPGVHILFVGINPGLRSALTGHHFAGHSNRFWKLLYESGLVTEPLTYRDDWRLPEWKLGLTNIISRCSAGIDSLDPDEYRQGVGRLTRKIRRYRPRLVALLGVTIFRIIFSDDHQWELGGTRATLAEVPVFLLPNPSGRNAHYSYGRMLQMFQELRLAVHR
jgi:double-stranded uracil-DNA glycosylase